MKKQNPREPRGYAAQIRAMKVGSSMTFIREENRAPLREDEFSRFSRTVQAYGIRARGDHCQWGFETFSCLTSKKRLIIGCILTLVADMATDATHLPSSDDAE